MAAIIAETNGCLKRYIARELYRLLVRAPAIPAGVSSDAPAA